MNAEQYEPYSVVVDDADTEYEEWVLDSVTPLSKGDGWDVGCKGMHCLVPRLVERGLAAGREALEPKVGDTFRVYGRFGRPIQGMVLNGTVLWYRDQRQRAERERRDQENYEAQKQRRFAIEQLELDMRYERLPEPFKRRLDRFRAEDPRFRVESESYESFCLEQAALLADHFGSEDNVMAWNRLNSAEHSYDYEEQQRQAPEGYSDGHSNNTHGAAVRFAVALLRKEEV